MDKGQEAGTGIHPDLPPVSRKTILERLRTRPDSEHGQALFRIGVGGVASLFALLEPQSTTLSPLHLLELVLFLISSAILIFLDILRNPGINPPRRIAGMLVDIGCTTLFLATSREQGIVLVIIYLWVIIGNGFRYGRTYLLLSSALSAAGLTAVFLKNPIWSKEPWLYESFLLAIIILPLYMSSLIRKLYAALDAANDASRAKSQFLTTVSHELRTPLAGVIGIGDLLWKSNPTHEQRSLLQSLSASARSLQGLIENLLEISRTEAGKSQVQKEPFNLFRLLGESTRTIAPLAHEKKILFSFRLSGFLPEILSGDERRLHQVLVNLLGNAVKFTERGKVELSVSGLRTTDHSGYLRVIVEDTGIGIPEEIQPRIFERFVQGDASVTRKYGGTGLGTSIAREMVETMGGTIGFASQIGVGTRFWFEVPFTCEDPSALSVRNPGPEAGPVRILYMNFSEEQDDLPSRLPGDGVELTIVKDRQSALDYVTRTFMENNSPEALVVKIGQRLQEWDDALSLLRSSPLLDVLPVIFVEKETPLTLPALSDLWSIPRIYTILPPDPALLLPMLRVLPTQKWATVREEGQKRRSLSVLVAEDNAINRRVLQEMLREAGHTVSLAHDGEEALDLLEESPDGLFDAMILDYNMPGQGGLDVLKAARFMNPRSRIASMILTAAVTPEVEEVCRKTGVDAFLAKPVDSRILIGTLDRIVREKAEKPFPKMVRKNRAKILDPEVFEKLSRVSSSPSFLSDLLQSFRSDGYRLLFEMEEAVGDGDHTSFLDKAHAMKGGALQVGAMALSEACSLVSMLKVSEMETTRPNLLLSAISGAFRETLESLERQLGTASARAKETDPTG